MYVFIHIYICVSVYVYMCAIFSLVYLYRNKKTEKILKHRNYFEFEFCNPAMLTEIPQNTISNSFQNGNGMITNNRMVPALTLPLAIHRLL